MSVSMGTNDLSYSSCESFPGRLCPCPCVQVYFCMVWHTRVYYFVVCYLMVYYGSVVCTHVLMSKCSFPSPSFVETSKVTTFRPMSRPMFKSMFKPTYSLSTVKQLKYQIGGYWRNLGGLYKKTSLYESILS